MDGGSKDVSGTAAKDTISIGTDDRVSGADRMGMEVHDYADMLTDEQEEKLEKKIQAAQRGISADIVIVIMNESIEAMYPDLIYMRNDETDAYRGIRRYTESFWIDRGFGWNEAGNTGNGIIMVDNIYRESNGWVYNWVAGAGDLRFSVGNDNCEELSQSFTDRLPAGDMPRYSQVYADALMEFVDDCSTFGRKIRGMLGWRLYTPGVMLTTIGSSVIAAVAVFIVLCVIFGRMVWHLHYNGMQKKERSGKQDRKPEEVREPFARRSMLAPDIYRITRQEDRLVSRYTTSYTESSGGGSSGGGGGFSGGGGGGGGGFSGGGSHR